jgi:uncharacterized protein
MSNEEIISPWYKQPWFWFLLIFPGAAIIWCISMITVAMNIDSSLVMDDYAKKGRGIALERARDETARAMGLEASLDFDSKSASLTMEAENGTADFPYLVLQLYHPTLADRDRTIQFRPSGNGQYTASLNQPIDGRWYFDLRGPDNDWRLKGEAYLPLSQNLILGYRTDDRG